VSWSQIWLSIDGRQRSHRGPSARVLIEALAHVLNAPFLRSEASSHTPEIHDHVCNAPACDSVGAYTDVASNV